MLTTQAPPPSQAAAPAAQTAPVSPSTPASPAAPAPAAAPATAPASPAPAPTNLVSAASSLEIPDKFKVAKPDGTIDHEATLQKALGSVVHLEKRLGSGDVPPETEEGYKLDYASFPEGIKISPEGEKALLKSLHSAGMTNKQVQTVINKYGEVIKAGLDIQKTQEAQRVAATLKDVATELGTAWGANFEVNKSAAVRGFNHLADEADKADLAKIGSDAKVTYRILMKVLAKVGAGITEDTQVLNADGATLDNNLEALRSSKAYLDENDPQHKATVAKVTALYQRKFPPKK